MALTTQLIDTHVGKVELHRGGSGAPLVYLHSATGEGAGTPFTESLTASFDVIAPMFPGFGESQGIEQIDDMDDAVFHLLDLFDVLGLDAPAVAGTSLGGWMALELATRYPDRVSRLALVNSVGLYLPDAPIKDIFGRSPSEMAEDLFHDQSHPIAVMMHAIDYRSDPGQLGSITFDMLRPVVTSMAATARLGWDPYLHNPKLAKRLHRIAAPTLVVHAAHDTLVPAAHATFFAENIPRARLAVLPDAAHLAPLERGPELADLVREFLDG
jgi:pimeloyl-ACP methyl ester carboxylesterase